MDRVSNNTQEGRCLKMMLKVSQENIPDTITTAITTRLDLCCCSPSATNFDVLSVQRCSSAYYGCNKRLFDSLLSSYQLEASDHHIVSSWVIL